MRGGQRANAYRSRVPRLEVGIGQDPNAARALRYRGVDGFRIIRGNEGRLDLHARANKGVVGDGA